MIVLDTNVFSELMRKRPEPAVLSWIDSCEDELWTTSVTLQELVFGMARVHDGAHRAQLQGAFDAAFPAMIGDRVLALDARAGAVAGEIIAACSLLGRPIGMADAQIAAIVRVHQATLVTRDTNDFANLGLSLINPWPPS